MDPMLATAVSVLPTGPGWAYEFKWDGVRALLDAGAGAARLTSRAGNDISGGYPELVRDTVGMPDALLDGEIVAFADGRPSFERLQTRMHLRGRAEVADAMRRCPVTFVAFDLLRHRGTSLSALPLRRRRAALEHFLAPGPDVRGAGPANWTLSPIFDDGPATEQVARQQGLEGVVAKRWDAPYRFGARTDQWRKLRFTRSGDFVVVGWEAAADRADVLSSLLLAVVREGGLRFAGKVGSGISVLAAEHLQGLLSRRSDPPIAAPPAPTRGRVLHWTEPELVVEVQFSEWTGSGRLRAPVYRGLRTDKRAEQAHGDG